MTEAQWFERLLPVSLERGRLTAEGERTWRRAHELRHFPPRVNYAARLDSRGLGGCGPWTVLFPDPEAREKGVCQASPVFTSLEQRTPRDLEEESRRAGA